MKRTIKKAVAYGLVTAMILQIAHAGNYSYLKTVFAIQQSGSNMAATTEETSVTDAQKWDEPAGEVATEKIPELSETEEVLPDSKWETPIQEAVSDVNYQELNVDGGVIEGDYAISIPSKLTSDLTVKGNLIVYCPLDLNGYTLIVEGKVTQSQYPGSVLSINGDLIVAGDYEWIAGNLSFESGYMDIGGSYYISSKSSGVIFMEHPEDYLLVRGNIVINFDTGFTTQITDGTIELKGDFTQQIYYYAGNTNFSTGDFLAEGNSTLLLSGEGKQNIYIARDTSGFQHIAVSTENLEQDEQGSYLFGERQIGFSGLYNYETYESYGCPTTYGYAEYSELPADTNVICGGCYYTGEPLHLQGGTLNIVGDFIQDADLYLEGGTLYVQGDYRVQSVTPEGEYGDTTAVVDCIGGGTLYIYGDFITQSVTDHTEHLNAGQWYIYGGLYQVGRDSKNLVTSGAFKLYLYASKDENIEEQHIYMENPLENPIAFFENRMGKAVVIDNGAIFEALYLNGNTFNYSGLVYLTKDIRYVHYTGNVKIIEDINIGDYVNIDGDAVIRSAVTVTGTMSVKGNLNIESGTLTVNRNITANDIIFPDGSVGSLDMTYEGGSITCNNFYYGSTASSKNLTAGAIYLKNDFYVKDNGMSDSFVCSDKHKVVTNGEDGIQTITIESPDSCIETLAVYNGTGGSVRVTDGTTIHTVDNRSHAYAWEGIAGYALEQDMVYNEDLILYGGTLDLNGHTLTINGDFYAERGTLYINGGHLVINGNLNCIYRDWVTGELELENSAIDIVMDNDNDQMDIAGDWNAIFATHSLTNMTKGKVNLSGNMDIQGMAGSDYSPAAETIMNGTGLYLTGTQEQTITGVSKNIIICPGDFTVTNEQKINVEIPVKILGTLQLSESLDYTFYSITIQNLDLLAGHTFKGCLSAVQSELTEDVRIDGDLTIDGRTDLCGHHLYAKNLTVNAYTTLSGGGLHVDSLYMYKEIYMQNPNDVIDTVDMYVKVTTWSANYMTEGNINIAGDFKDNTTGSLGKNEYVFQPSGNHTITFMKTDSSVSNPASITFSKEASKLNRVILKNKLNCYTLNREVEEIANEVILDYEDEEKPEIPQNIVAGAEYCQVNLAWDEAVDNMEIHRYKIYRNGVYVGRTSKTTYTDGILKYATTYRYQITAVDAKGNESDMSPVVEVTTLDDKEKPYCYGTPATTLKKDSISINCSSAYKDDETYIDYYIITKDGEEAARLKGNAGAYYEAVYGNGIPYQGVTSYSEEGLEKGIIHQYGITAVDIAGNRSEEYTWSVMADLPPSAPKKFRVDSENANNMVSFMKSGNAECSYYKIYRGSTYIKQIKNDKAELETYIDKSVTVGKSYSYYVVPYNKYDTAGEATNTLYIETTQEYTPPEFGEIKYIVNEDISNMANSYQYSFNGDILNEDIEIQVHANDFSGVADIYAYLTREEEEQISLQRSSWETVAADSYADFVLEVNGLEGQYDLHIVAVDGCGNEAEEVKSLQINMAGLQPVSLLAASATAGIVSLKWEAVEDASSYIVEQKVGDSYQAIYRTGNTTQNIIGLESDTEYTFRIATRDKNNVRGLPTEDIVITTETDTEPPRITSIHGSSSVLGPDTALQIGYRDNVKVRTVSAFYRRVGTSEWKSIGEMAVGTASGTIQLSWDKTGLESGAYEVQYQLEDSSGNMAEELVITYTLDLDGPVISNYILTPEDWQIRLDWEPFEENDFEYYELFRMPAKEYDGYDRPEQISFSGKQMVSSGYTECSYEEMISPEEEYVYRLCAYDTYGNTSIADVRGCSIDNDVFEPEVPELPEYFAAKDVAVFLSAAGCTDNVGIVSYEWDMGNGDIIYGQNCEYIYQEVGTYQITLTAVDASGNRGSKTTTVTVGKDTGTVKVTVQSGGKAIPDANVVACINGKACQSGARPVTNGQGQMILQLPAGTYMIAAYKDGYQPAETAVCVTTGEATEVTVNLKKEEMVQAEITAKEMTKEEMEEAGIDITVNRTVVEYEVNLKYEKTTLPTIKLNSVQNSTELVYTSPSYDSSGKPTSSTTSYVKVTNVSSAPEKPILVITKTAKVSISWLQTTYQVDVTISNMAEKGFYLEDTVATFVTKDGMNMSTMNEGVSNDEKWEIGTLDGGESQSHTWYVGIDESGSYPLQIKLDAILQPFDEPVHKTLVSENNLEVEVGKGLHLYVYPEKDAYIGEQYYIQFELRNESSADYHYVSTSFGAFETVNKIAKNVTIVNIDGEEITASATVDSGIDYYLEDKEKSNTSVTLCTDDKLTVETLAAGESIWGTYKFQFDAAGDIYREYYRLINEYVEEMNVNNTNMAVTIQAVDSHLKKTFTDVKLRTRKKKTTSSTKSNYTITYDDKDAGQSNTSANETTTNATTAGAITSTVTTQDSTETVKDPVNLMTGAFMVDHVVAAVSGATELSFGLSYNSLYTDTTGELGRGWYHNYEMRIERNGTMLTLYQNPYEVLYFTESEKTANTVCGTLDGGTILLANDSGMERTYYQTGTDSKVSKITKNADGYVLAAGQEQYTFDTDGILTGYMTSDGKQVTIQKNKETLTITDSATGKSITASYDDEGRITDIVDAAGNRTTLDYDEDYMTVLTSKTGNKLSYEYDEQGRILKGMEADGTVYVENTYDEKGRVLTQTANGKKEEMTSFAYSEDTDEETTTVTMTNADGTTQKAVADKFGQGIRYVDAIGGVKEYRYNQYHEMTGYQCSDGTGAEYSYDGNGNVSRIVETTGRTTSYTYDSSNRITRMVCNDGTDVSYTYHANGQMKTITSGNGLKASYTYNEDGQVLTETSELGTITYTYEKGMLRAITDYSGNSHYFTYDANGNVVQYIDGAGIVTDYQVDASGRVTEESITMEDGSKASISYTYDAYGKVTSKTDAMGNTTSYVYDEEDRLAEEKRPDGKSYTYEYDVNGNITKIICPDGSTTAEAIYDAAGNALSLTDTLKNIRTAGYSAGSQLLSMTQSNGGEITYTYYDNGLLESQTDANGNTTVLLYDDAGRISQVTDGVGAVTCFGYDKDGNLASVEDALGNSTKLVYNQYRKVIRQTDANGNVTEYDYDNALNCIRITDAEGGVTELAYDANGNITAMTKKGDTEEQDITLSMTYDNLGNVISLTDGEGNTSRMEYDVNSDLTAVYDAEGVKIQEYDYDCFGNCIRATDALGNVTSNSYDAMGNLVRQMNEGTGNAVTYSYIGGQYLASSTDALGNTASATYDSMGNIATLTNPNGGVTSYQYDLNNNLTDESIGTDYHVSYTYNAQNLAETKVNSRGQQTAYEYDLLGRITKQTDEAGMIDYTYDANGNVLTVTETIGTTVNTITRTYDALNRVTSYEDAKGNKIEYQYDRIGNLVKLIYPNRKAVTYTYDKNCNIKTVTDWENRTTTYSYDSNGRLVKTERPNGTVETRAYDKAGKLIQILDKCGSTVVNQQEYTYDASGNITEVKQLYDGELNFTGVTTAKMTYDENNRLLTYNGKKVQYDKDGNMTYGPLNGKMTEFVFDCRNRLVKAGDTSYEYDAENNRVAMVTGNKRIEYVVDSQPELSQVLQSTVIEGDKEEVTYYFYGKGLLAQDNQEGYLTYHFNNVGSTMAVTDVKGRVNETYNYTPYGELIDGTYSDNIPFLYNGQYGVTTDGNGLYYMRARYYNVDVKRFINQDVLTGTLERISSLNRYAYVEGNPVSYLDPFGLAKTIDEELRDDLRNGLLIASIALSIIGILIATTVTTFAVPYAMMMLAGADFLVNAMVATSYMADLLDSNSSSERKTDALVGLITFGIGMIVSNVLNMFDTSVVEDVLLNLEFSVISDTSNKIEQELSK